MVINEASEVGGAEILQRGQPGSICLLLRKAFLCCVALPMPPPRIGVISSTTVLSALTALEVNSQRETLCLDEELTRSYSSYLDAWQKTPFHSPATPSFTDLKQAMGNSLMRPQPSDPALEGFEAKQETPTSWEANESSTKVVSTFVVPCHPYFSSV